jgi:hypothetical protein
VDEAPLPLPAKPLEPRAIGLSLTRSCRHPSCLMLMPHKDCDPLEGHRTICTWGLRGRDSVVVGSLPGTSGCTRTHCACRGP